MFECHMYMYTLYGTCQKKGCETHANTLRRLARSVCSRSIHAIRVLTFAKFTKCAQYTVVVRMHIGIYTVRKLRDNTVAMGLRFCLHEVVAKNHNQFAAFFLTSTICRTLTNQYSGVQLVVCSCVCL